MIPMIPMIPMRYVCLIFVARVLVRCTNDSVRNHLCVLGMAQDAQNLYLSCYCRDVSQW